MEVVVIVTVLALLQYTFFGAQAGQARRRSGANATAVPDNEQHARANRIHLNTLEQLAVFLPALWMYAQFVNPLWGACMGLVYLVGRFVYRTAYMKDPSTRTLGFVMTFMPSIVMLGWVLVSAVMSYF